MAASNPLGADGIRRHQARAGAAIIDISGLLLGEFVRRSAGNVNIRIVANTVARAMKTTSSIVVLCNHQDVQSAWVLHRTLAERLFHLASLSATKSYADFEAWSFYVQAKGQKKAQSDELFSHRTNGPEHQLSADHELRFRAMTKNPPIWKRPKSEDVAKQMGVKFIYDYAYDYASTLIHPMANDGEMDLLASQNLDDYQQRKDLVIHNSLLVLTLILQEAMNSPGLNWCAAAYDMVAAARAFIDDPNSDYQTPRYKSLALLSTDGLSCIPQP